METLSKISTFLLLKLSMALGLLMGPACLLVKYLVQKVNFQPPRMRDFKIAKRDFYANTTNFNKLWKLVTIFSRIVASETINFTRPNYLERRREPLFYAAIGMYFMLKSIMKSLNYKMVPFVGSISRMNCDFLTPTEAKHLAELTYENSDFQLSVKFYKFYLK